MKPNKYYSNIQEKLVASMIDGKQVTGSGARPFHYGDVISDEWLVECKTHTEPGHNIYFGADIWSKIQKEAIFHHRMPALVVDEGSQKSQNTWCLIHKHNVDWSTYSLYGTKNITTKNITLRNEDLQELYSTLDYSQLYSFKWNNKEVVILPLERFSEMM